MAGSNRTQVMEPCRSCPAKEPGQHGPRSAAAASRMQAAPHGAQAAAARCCCSTWTAAPTPSTVAPCHQHMHSRAAPAGSSITALWAASRGPSSRHDQAVANRRSSCGADPSPPLPCCHAVTAHRPLASVPLVTSPRTGGHLTPRLPAGLSLSLRHHNSAAAPDVGSIGGIISTGGGAQGASIDPKEVRRCGVLQRRRDRRSVGVGAACGTWSARLAAEGFVRCIKGLLRNLPPLAPPLRRPTPGGPGECVCVFWGGASFMPYPAAGRHGQACCGDLACMQSFIRCTAPHREPAHHLVGTWVVRRPVGTPPLPLPLQFFVQRCRPPAGGSRTAV